jgi:hypothetical protein
MEPVVTGSFGVVAGCEGASSIMLTAMRAASLARSVTVWSILCRQKRLDGIDVFAPLPIWPDIKGKSQQNE